MPSGLVEADAPGFRAAVRDNGAVPNTVGVMLKVVSDVTIGGEASLRG
jgi:hypothetical protein